MFRLPDELVILILSKLEPVEVARAQSVCQRLSRLARDAELWKLLCFRQTTRQAQRRRQQRLLAQDESLAALSRAARDLPASGLDQSSGRQVSQALSADTEAREFAEWDPSRGRSIDFCSEYRARYGPIDLHWFDTVWSPQNHRSLETTGAAVLYTPAGIPQAGVAPVEDGSICLWALSGYSDESSIGSIVCQSHRSLLSLSRTGQMSSPDGAVETVAIESHSRTGYFAVQDRVLAIDLNTMQEVRQAQFPFPVTTLSEATAPTPITVGTSSTLHLFDCRSRRLAHSAATDVRHTTLSQPGPQSILHLDISTIFVAGRFSSLLRYDRRFWPRIQSTLFSGARLSSLCALDCLHLPRDYSLLRDPSLTISQYKVAKTTSGNTLVACGEYKGKGSLELYGITGSGRSTMSPTVYQNRQTASKSRLLSVANHGCRLVYSDGDGELRWVEQDGSSLVRAININDPQFARLYPGQEVPSVVESADPREAPPSGDDGDIVQKIVSLAPNNESAPEKGLLLWAGGQIAQLNFGHANRRATKPDSDASPDDDTEEQRLYERRMRRALETQTAEIHFVRQLGLPT